LSKPIAKSVRVAIYARVSTAEQSLDAQLRDLREYAARRGWPESSEYLDHGVSGAKDSRPGWNACWDALQKRKHDVLLVAALDRLGRSLPHLVKVIGTLCELGVTLVSLRENIDLGTAQGRMMAGLFGVLAEYERELIRERTKAGMRAAKARGSRIGPPKRHFDTRRATELRDAGMGQLKIARLLGIGVGRVNAWCREEYRPPSERGSE
jgi:DNA invertase Pin-like site-specific DNA recombinase